MEELVWLGGYVAGLVALLWGAKFAGQPAYAEVDTG